MQPLPTNAESERELIGNLIKDNNQMMDVIQVLKVNDFYMESHKKIYGAMEEMFKNNIEIDIVTLATKLKDSLQFIGGITYITKLFESSMGRGTKAHIDIIKDCSIRRNIIKQSSLMMEQAFSDVKPKDIINEFSDSMLDISTEGSKMFTAAEVMEKTLNYVETNYKNGGGIIGMSCGLKTIDYATDGFIKKDVVVIAARPSMGKTLFATTLADGLSKNYKTAIFELEMSEESLGVRMLASKAMLNGVKLRRGDLQESEWNNITRSASNLSTRKLWIDTNAVQTIYDVKAKAKRLKVTTGLDLIIIDHIGLLEETGKNIGNRLATISEITRQAKIMAKELDICVVLLSQLNRSVEQRADKRPILSDLRESGSVEQDADLIMFLYRDEYYNPESEDNNILEVGIAKQRNGKTGTLKLACVLGLQVIADLDVVH